MFELEIVYWHVDMKICLVSIKIKESIQLQCIVFVFSSKTDDLSKL